MLKMGWRKFPLPAKTGKFLHDNRQYLLLNNVSESTRPMIVLSLNAIRTRITKQCYRDSNILLM
jgi:hypothetical protein